MVIARKLEGQAYLRQSGQLAAKKARKKRNVTLMMDLADQLQYWNDYQGSAELCKLPARINPNYPRSFQLLALAHSHLNQKTGFSGRDTGASSGAQ